MKNDKEIGSRKIVQELDSQQQTEFLKKVSSRVRAEIDKCGHITVVTLISCIGLALADINLFFKPYGGGEIKLSALGITLKCEIGESEVKVLSYFSDQNILHAVPITELDSTTKRVVRYSAQLTQVIIEALNQSP